MTAGPGEQTAAAAESRLGARRFWTWTALGSVAAAGVALTGSAVGSVPDPGHASWWFTIARGGSTGTGWLFYLSVALLLAAWLGIGSRARSGLLTTSRAWTVLALWALPLALGPPLFSRDLYSYISQGVIAHRGLNPYTVGPSVLGPGPVLGSVAAACSATPRRPTALSSSRHVDGWPPSSERP